MRAAMLEDPLKTRKDFLATVASAGALYAGAAAPLAALAAPEPTPMPTPTPKPPKTSDTAKAMAAKMRAYDPHLSDKQIADIAKGMDFYLGLGGRVNPKGKALKNSDEPATLFEVRA